MGNTDPKVTEKNKIFIVDPNPPGMQTHPPEDLFIYVKFSAMNRNRSTYLGDDEKTQQGIFTNTGTQGEINFIATQVAYDSDDNVIVDDEQVQKTYATTSYTNIGGIQDANSRGTLEGFGIKSIDIKYNASLVPTVDITFTDLRGSSLFDVVEHKNRKSPYSIFFKMPYPIFTLSIKGYFGKTVDYCLHMTNWSSNFDGTTGNFDISANFVGFQQAFLADMVLGNIIGTVNTQQGYNNLNKIFDEEDNATQIGANIPYADVESGKELNIRKLDDFLVRVSKLQIDVETIKQNSPELESLNILNQKLAKLERIQTFIGTPLRKAVVTPTNSKEFNEGNVSLGEETNRILSVEYKENDPKQIITSPIELGNNLKIGRDYLSIRDFIIFNSISRVAIERYFNTLTSLIDDYQKFVNDAEDLSDTFKTFSTIDKTSEKDFIDLFQLNEDKNGNITISYTSFLYEDKVETQTLDNIFNSFSTPGTSPAILFYEKVSQGSSQTTNITGAQQNTNPNSSFNIGVFKKATPGIAANEQTRNDYTKDGMELNNSVLMLDFRKVRAKLKVEIDVTKTNIKEQRTKAEDAINAELEKSLDFSPKIRDVFRILCNNTDAMLQTVAGITLDASNPQKKDARIGFLTNRGYSTDTPADNKNSYAWPTIYESTDKGVIEIYMGEIDGIPTDGTFPEYSFVDEVFDNLVARRRQLQDITKVTNPKKGGSDTDNWFPINPIDAINNPYYLLNNLSVEKEINQELMTQLFTRSTVLNTYSSFNMESGSNHLTDYAALEGINANKTIIARNLRSTLSEILRNPSKLIQYALDNKIVEKKNDHFILLKQDNKLPRISGFEVSGSRDNSVDYIILDNNQITNNATTLLKDIKDSSEFKRITLKNEEVKKNTGDYYLSTFKYNNFKTSLFYNVWNKDINQELVTQNKEYKDQTTTYPINGIPDTIEPINMIDPLPKDSTTGVYINKLNGMSSVEDDTTAYDINEGILTAMPFYQNQTSKASKGLLLLSTFPWRSFEESVLKILQNTSGEYKGARILSLPTYYLYLIGGLLWRASKPTDPIEWTDFPNLKTPQDQYLSRLGYLGAENIKKGSYTPQLLEEGLLKLPTATKQTLIDEFTSFINYGDFDKFEASVKKYKNDKLNNNLTESEIEKKEKAGAQEILTNHVNKLTQFIVVAPAIFNPNGVNEGLKISVTDFDSFLSKFTESFNFTNLQTNKKERDTQANTQKSDRDEIKTKLQIYNYFKNINDKWIASSKGKSYNACGGTKVTTTSDGSQKIDGPNLIEYFKFLSRGFTDLGDTAVVNLNSLLTLSNNMDTNMYYYISKLLRDSNFLFQILPTFIDYNSAEEVKDMFRPISIVSDGHSKKGPVYTCIYIGSSSQYLDIGDGNEYYYSNDGYSLNDNETPPDMALAANEDREFSLVAFKVGFGAENQGIFKNVSLNQQEHRETAEYFSALSDLVDKRGGTQRSYQGTDLLRLFKTRSYTCKVDALGCMNIQPLMYFDLQNVPFFNGAYLITSVNHNIMANHMTTSFTGLRQSKYLSPPVTEVTAFLNIDLDEGNNDPPVPFTNLTFKDSIYNIGVSNPTDPFDYGSIPEFKDSLNNIGIILEDSEVEELQSTLKTYKITSNSQVTMFLSIAATNSNYLKERERVWNIEGNGSDFQERLEKHIVYKKDNNGNNVPQTWNNETVTLTTINGKEVWNPPKYLLYNPPGDNIQNALAGFGGNTEEGYAYRFRHRGFIYMVGKSQYERLLDNKKLKSFYDDPQTLTQTFENTMTASALVWNDKPTPNTKSSNELAGADGSAATFAAIIEQQNPNNGIQEYFETHEQVLSNFNLLVYGDPVGA